MLLVVAAMSFLYVVGLPDFLKPRLLNRIRERGFEARFTSARLGWGPSIVIENAGFSPTNRTSGPYLSAGLTEVKLDWNALLHRHLKADSVTVLNGQVKIPVSERFGKTLSLDNVSLTMRLSSNDFAHLSDFSATFRGIRIRIDGEVTNFASVGNWKLPGRWHAAPRQSSPSQPAAVANFLDQLHFGSPAKLDIHFSADGSDINTLRAEAMFTAPTVETPWASARGFQLRAAAAHLLDFTNRPFMQARVNAGNISTRWGTGGHVSLTAAFFPDSSTPFNAQVSFSGDKLDGKWNSSTGANWVRADRLSWDGRGALSLANFRPTALEGTLRVAGADSPWGSAGAFSLALKADQLEATAPADPAWGIWTRFSPYSCSCHFLATNIQSPELRFESLVLDANWRAPQMTIEKVEGRLYQGKLDGGADLDVASREVRVHAAADFNPHSVAQVLTPAAQRWISQFTWQSRRRSTRKSGWCFRPGPTGPRAGGTIFATASRLRGISPQARLRFAKSTWLPRARTFSTPTGFGRCRAFTPSALKARSTLITPGTMPGANIMCFSTVGWIQPTLFRCWNRGISACCAICIFRLRHKSTPRRAAAGMTLNPSPSPGLCWRAISPCAANRSMRPAPASNTPIISCASVVLGFPRGRTP